ncbi:MAG: NTP transferase domain-containing protein [Ignavibacteria bacterium]|nr:NTP transferase domain-containing protein [Ignavibacteria bacterium]
MRKKLVTVIMAAGKGKRMRNPDKSKVMHELKGKPMIQYVVELSEKINSEMIIPVVGHQKHSVMDYLTEKFPESTGKIEFAHQDEQLGTGHAVMQTKEHLENFDGDVLILSGDVPLLKYETVDSFLKFHNENNFDASLISAIFNDPSGYGRVLRDKDGNFYDIREEKDCIAEEKMCKEINSGIYIIDNKILFEALKTLKTDNAQGEYYLTDVFKYFRSIGKKIGAFPVKDVVEISGINTMEQLEELSNY